MTYLTFLGTSIPIIYKLWATCARIKFSRNSKDPPATDPPNPEISKHVSITSVARRPSSPIPKPPTTPRAPDKSIYPESNTSKSPSANLKKKMLNSGSEWLILRSPTVSKSTKRNLKMSSGRPTSLETSSSKPAKNSTNPLSNATSSKGSIKI